MALERNNPLPVGWYWVDVPTSKVGAFTGWLSEHPNTIKVRETRVVNSSGAGEEGYSSYSFQVLAPTPWEGPGYPTIGSKYTKLDETVEKPDPPPDLYDEVKSVVSSGKGLLWIAGGAIALGAAVALRRR